MNTLSNFSQFALTRGEMKRISGGCNYWVENGGVRTYSPYSNLSSAYVQKKATSLAKMGPPYVERAGWCCASCP